MTAFLPSVRVPEGGLQTDLLHRFLEKLTILRL